MSESTEIVRRPVALGSPMTDLDAAYRLAKALAMAGVMPNALRGKPSDVLALMLYGQDLGLSPMQSIQGIYVVKGKPQLSSQTWTALARRAGHKVREIESTRERCTIEITTKDDPEHPHRETYTIKLAAEAGLVTIKEDGTLWARSQKGERLPWETNTKTMLRNRAISNGAKLACPEVALGFAIEGDYDYIPDDTVVEVVAPEVMQDVVVTEPEKAVEEIASLVGEFDFSTAVEAEVVQPEPTANYTCLCGAVGEHFEDDCPKAAADA
ncbi:recombinase RecT [Streptosporangium canum]|uniref:recombinase RecT n=1 Tax=Streptosporangium canum TaxID=324952 RepID=UPI0037A948F0